MLPSQVDILVVGGGPVGLTAALSLKQSGIDDILVIDASEERSSHSKATSRAVAIHSGTLQALERLGCNEDLLREGTRCRHMTFSDASSPIIQADFDFVKGYTKYPFVLVIPQGSTEEVLDKHVRDLNVVLERQQKVVGLTDKDDGFEVTLESGHVIHANHVIGADGARSTVRNLAGIPFRDPESDPTSGDHHQDIHDKEPSSLAQLVIADVTFTQDISNIVPNSVTISSSPAGLALIIPLPDTYRIAHGLAEGEKIYRIGFGIPPNSKDLAQPEPHPPVEYLQSCLNRKGHMYFSKLVTVPRIKQSLWSNRFRLSSAAADSFLISRNDGKNIIMLVGDAAHIHPPAGGQGVNIGMRDAIGLGPVFAQFQKGDRHVLEEYAQHRREKALEMIRRTRMLFRTIQGLATGTGPLAWVGRLLMKLAGRIPFVQNKFSWALTGLADQ